MNENGKTKFRVEMPSGKAVEVEPEMNLRTSLKKHFNEIYHKNMRLINCKGFGTCGTCAMKIKGQVTEPTHIEKWRLNFFPHEKSLEKGIRLLCQCYPLSDLKLEKLDGRWGQGYE